MKKSILVLLATSLLAQGCGTTEDPLVGKAESALQKASAYFHSISTQGGYAGIYSVDLKERYGESFYEEAEATEIWVQPPGTPSVGESYLRAYRITGEQEYLKAATDAARALAWLDQSRIGDNLWARLYEEGTNRPIYGDREDGNKVHYDYEQISERERTSDGWQGEYGIAAVTSYYREVVSMSAADYLAAREQGLTSEEQAQKAISMEPEIRSIIAGMDEMGRWISEDVITCRDFVRNVNRLCEYLELKGRSSK
jgi:hypothetical protein